MEQGGELTSTASKQPRTSPSASAATEAAAETSWEDVPDNILVRVSAFLPCRADRVHMACANRLWNAAVRGLRRPPPPVLPPLPPLPPQLPWIIFPSTEAPNFYSAITRRYHPLCRLPPDVRRARCCGSGDGGWLVLALDSCHEHALYNLNSGQRIPLPPRVTTPTADEYPLAVRTATLSSAPSPDAPYMVAAIVLIAARSTAAFWRVGSDHWFSTGDLLTERPQDVICHQGTFFFLTSRESLIGFSPGYDRNGNAMQSRFDYNIRQREDYDADVELMYSNGTMKRYLVLSRGRVLMAVRYINIFDNEEAATEMIRVFQLGVPPVTNCQRSRGNWECLGGHLDGRMLFLGPGCSRSFEVAHYDGFEESMIYVLPSVDDGRPYSFTDMGRYSMEEITYEPWPPGLHPSWSDNAPPTWWLH